MPRRKILLIEDDYELCEFLELHIKHWGFDLTVAHDGQDGLEKTQELHPDLVILDLGLPKLPGEEVCRQLRKDDDTAEIPILMETAKDSDVDRVVGRVIGADGYLVKPFSPQELLKEIKRIIALSI